MLLSGRFTLVLVGTVVVLLFGRETLLLLPLLLVAEPLFGRDVVVLVPLFKDALEPLSGRETTLLLLLKLALLVFELVLLPFSIRDEEFVTPEVDTLLPRLVNFELSMRLASVLFTARWFSKRVPKVALVV